MTVPNLQPLRPTPNGRKLAVVGDLPALEDEQWCRCPRGHGYSRQFWSHGLQRRDRCPACASTESEDWPEPFRSHSGRLLEDCLRRAGASRDSVFLGNCWSWRPEAERLAAGPDDAVLERLCGDLDRFAPNCLLLLGETALRAFHPRRDAKIGDWRGSLFASRGVNGRAPYKCCATYHPASILRGGPRQAGEAGAQPEWMPMLRFDCQRAAAEALSPAMNLPQRRFWMPDDSGALVVAVAGGALAEEAPAF